MDKDDISRFLQKILSARSIVVLIILGALAVFVYRNFDFITEITFKIERPKSESKAVTAEPKGEPKKSAKIGVVVTLIPLQFDIPSYLLIGVKNTGSVAVTNLEAVLHLGRPRIEKKDIKPKERCVRSSGK